MSRPSYITVSAPPGRLTPIHPDDGREPGGRLMMVEAGAVRRVRLSPFIARQIAHDDLFPCDLNGRKVASVELADCPDDLDAAPRPTSGVEGKLDPSHPAMKPGGAS